MLVLVRVWSSGSTGVSASGSTVPIHPGVGTGDGFPTSFLSMPAWPSPLPMLAGASALSVAMVTLSSQAGV